MVTERSAADDDLETLERVVEKKKEKHLSNGAGKSKENYRNTKETKNKENNNNNEKGVYNNNGVRNSGKRGCEGGDGGGGDDNDGNGVDNNGRDDYDNDGDAGNVDDDPWDVAEEKSNEPNWKELTTGMKVLRVVLIVMRVVAIMACVYFFICSLDCLQYAFQMLSGRSAGDLFSNSVLVNNPVSAMMIGVFVTVLVQSSSTSSSIVVTLVGANILTVRQAIPLVMGANIGTTVTSTIVALTQSPNRNVFRRAFAGATVHDAFNWLSVIVLLPLEVASGFLYHVSNLVSESMNPVSNTGDPQFLQVITKPLTSLIIQIDKDVMTAVAQGTDRQRFPLAKYWKKISTNLQSVTVLWNETKVTRENILKNPFNYNLEVFENSSTNTTIFNYTQVDPEKSVKANHLFAGAGLEGFISEAASGSILLFTSLLLMTFCLVLLVKILSSLFKGPMTKLLRRGLNADLPGRFSYFTGYVVMLVGMLITVLFQSSSVFTSAINPLIGMGLITVERAYPVTLGSNIGTTVTAILAAFTAEPEYIRNTIQISMCHLFFNISGILLFYPVPFTRVPIPIAKALGNTTAKYRWFAVFYLVVMFAFVPMLVFGLSMTPNAVGLIVVGCPLILLLVVVIVLNVLQRKKPNWLPKKLKSWKFLPRFLRSVGFYDYYVQKLLAKLNCCKKCKGKKSSGDGADRAGEAINGGMTRKGAGDSGKATDGEIIKNGAGSGGRNGATNHGEDRSEACGRERNDKNGSITNGIHNAVFEPVKTKAVYHRESAV